MKAKMMGALGAQSSFDKEDDGKKKKGKDAMKGKGKEKGWSQVRQASQESKGSELSKEEAAIIIQACKMLLWALS